MEARTTEQQLLELLTLVRDQGQELRQLRSEVQELRGLRTDDTKAFLSLRAAAKKLGVSRNKTLPQLIASGQVRTVSVNGKTRVSAQELERLGAEGFDVKPVETKKAPRPRAPKQGDAIRALKF